MQVQTMNVATWCCGMVLPSTRHASQPSRQLPDPMAAPMDSSSLPPEESTAAMAHKLHELRLELQTLDTLFNLRNGNAHQTPNPSDPTNHYNAAMVSAYRIACGNGQNNNNHHNHYDSCGIPTMLQKAFLRAEEYHPGRAAQRLWNYLDQKRDIFGDHTLQRDLVLDDLGEEGLAVLRLGGLQILPKRDAEGRRVIFGFPMTHHERHTILGARKAHFYFFTSLLDDETEAGLQKGLFGILWRVHQPIVDPAITQATSVIRQCAPIWFSSVHLCHGNDRITLQRLLSFLLLLPRQGEGKQRLYQTHYGTALECQYQLFAHHGCPSDCFPLQKASNPNDCFFNDNYEDGFAAETMSTTAPLFHTHYVEEWIAHRMHVDAEKKQRLVAGSGDGVLRMHRPHQNRDSPDIFLEDPDTPMWHRQTSWNTDLLRESIETIENESIGAAVAAAAAELPLDPYDGMAMPTGLDNNPLNQANGNSNPYGATIDELMIDSLLTLNEMEIESGGDDDDDDDNEDGAGLRRANLVNKRMNEDPLKPSIRIPHHQTRPGDVLLGRGRPLQRHPGNQRLRTLIANRLEAYEAANKLGKTDLAEAIVWEVHASGGRFLKPSSDDKTHTGGSKNVTVWEEIDDFTARSKVAYTFRTIRKEERNRSNNNGGNSGMST